ncbi:MAG: DUF5076 domain-containing protein [Planctomycetia bacterium]|nr:DUF5076 domain-containing protein [Planctomycetia bacterium]
MSTELPIPPAAVADTRSLEMIRVWIANKKQHCVLNIGFWEERNIDECHAWGVLLADMVRHIANAHEIEYGRDPCETINRVRESFIIEMGHPTSDHIGDFVNNEKRSSSKPKKKKRS